MFAKWNPIIDEYRITFYQSFGGDIIGTQVVRAGEMTENKSSYYKLDAKYEYGTFGGWRYQLNNYSAFK